MKFRKKPVVIEAVQWTGANTDEVLGLGETASFRRKNFLMDGGGIMVGGALVIETLEGEMTASPGDWIIKGVRGEFYPCKPEIFMAKYDQVEEPK